MKFLIPLLLIVFLGITAALMAYHKPHQSVAKLKPDFVTSADVLFEEFTMQEQRANEKYLDKVVMVKGEVKQISRGEGDRINVTLETGDEMFGVSCTFEKNHETMLDINEGDVINVKGFCAGMLMDVVLINCVTVNS